MTNEMDLDEFESIAVRIRHILELYPILSPTMLQAALGPQIKAEQWRPVLDDMIKNEVVKQETFTTKSPSNRFIDYQRLSLTGTNTHISTN